MDADVTARFAAQLTAHRDELVRRWRAAAAPSLGGRQTEAELGRQIEDIFRALSDLAAGGKLDLAMAEAGELRAVLREMSHNRARQGFTPTETAVTVFALKDAILEQTEVGDTRARKDYVEFTAFVDQMGLFTFESFAKARDELITDQAAELLELSTPVVKLWDGVVAVPLVGTLDSVRAQVVMERLLQVLVDTGSPHAIIDITGVPAVDTQVAQHVLKTVVAARLMGADCVISGIRPQIAQTIVALGIEFKDIVTKATLADALQHALRGNGVEMVQRVAPRAT